MTPGKSTQQENQQPVNRATVSPSAMVKWIEPTEAQVEAIQDFTPQFRNRSEYFDDLQAAVAGIAALMKSEMTAAEIIKQAKLEVKKLEAESYELVRDYLGEHVTDKMDRINTDLDELAALVAGIEASLAGFSPMMDEEEIESSSTSEAEAA